MKKFIASFIEYIKSEKGHSPHTIRNYESDLRQFSDFIAGKRGMNGGEPEIGIVDYMIIREYIGGLFYKCSRTKILSFSFADQRLRIPALRFL